VVEQIAQKKKKVNRCLSFLAPNRTRKSKIHFRIENASG
jgi:hypothetical protein